MASNDSIKVRLRVVGVFYDQMLTVKKDGSIKDLLDAAVLDSGSKTSSGRLDYTSKLKCVDKNGKATLINSLVGFGHNIKSPFSSLGAKPRKAGLYELSESETVSNGTVTVHAWQYYVIRDKKVFSNYWNGEAAFDASPANPSSIPADFPALPAGEAGFTAFDRVTLNPGDEVIWRNVSIVRNPQTPPIY